LAGPATEAATPSVKAATAAERTVFFMNSSQSETGSSSPGVMKAKHGFTRESINKST
jgi:hypothetical protein